MKSKEKEAVKMPLKGMTNSGQIIDSLTENNALEVNTEALTAFDEKTIRNAINTAIENYKLEYDTDIYSLTQIQWNHTLEYIYNNALMPYRIDYRNTELLYNIAKLYLSTCRLYNKSSSVYGLSLITNIPYSVLVNTKSSKYNIYIDTDNNIVIDNNRIAFYRYNNPNIHCIEIPNNTFSEVAKMVLQDRQHALADKAENGSVMSLALGKIEYGWEEGKRAQLQAEQMENYRLPSDLIDKYSDN